MLAYSSINHAGFILLGVVAGTARGASASLYYLFAYMFMTIGSFAIVTVLGRSGDGDHDLSRYRGLAGRQPVLALAFAVLLLAQAGAPFTTGLWAKVQVVFAVIAGGRRAAGRDRHGDGRRGRLLLPADRRPHVRRRRPGRARGGRSARPRRPSESPASPLTTTPSWAGPEVTAERRGHHQRAHPAGRRGARGRGRGCPRRCRCPS